MLLLLPLIYFGVGYVFGLVIAWAIGDTFIYGFNLLLNTTRFTVSDIPITTGVLSTFIGFAKVNTTKNN